MISEEVWSFTRYFSSGFPLYLPDCGRVSDALVADVVDLQGIIPLGECRLQAVQESSHPFCLQVDSHEIDVSHPVRKEESVYVRGSCV